ncbi:MAG: hypothetical protein CL725_09750 [Chloroflexi bacterium]|jgi:hypothetical protein|nr:hypothetical protein [Chloroflexota bacterium]MCS5654713.1 hypothetical protein [Dehalococcoidia bacterium]
MSRINVGNTCGLGATPVSGTAGDSDSVATEVGGMEVAVACVVGEGEVVMITVRVGSGTPHPKANTIRDRTTTIDGKHRLAFKKYSRE